MARTVFPCLRCGLEWSGAGIGGSSGSFVLEKHSIRLFFLGERGSLALRTATCRADPAVRVIAARRQGRQAAETFREDGEPTRFDPGQK
jgi:hypothetical protein